jgi:hypothetical protein
VDALNIVLTCRILSGLRIPNAATTALILYVLPFSWAGGAVWGQIDSVTQFFLLSYVFAFVKICEEKRSLLSDSAYFALAAVAFGLGIFSKQLFLFSVPSLIVGFALSTRIIVQRHGSRFAWSLPVPLVCTLVFLWIDRWPALPDSHRSHLAFLLSGFADDWTSIAGLNLWALKPGGPSLCHACTQSGLALYIVAMAYIFWVALALLKRQMHDSNLLFAVLVTLLGLSNLAFNVLLTGVHERYLFHTFPFLIIGGLVLTRKGLMRVPHLALTTAIGSVYGIYVWMILNAPLHHWPTRSLRGSLVVSLAALLGYSCVWLRELNRALISSSRVRAKPALTRHHRSLKRVVSPS